MLALVQQNQEDAIKSQNYKKPFSRGNTKASRLTELFNSNR